MSRRRSIALAAIERKARAYHRDGSRGAVEVDWVSIESATLSLSILKGGRVVEAVRLSETSARTLGLALTYWGTKKMSRRSRP